MLAWAHGRSPKAVVDSAVLKPVGGTDADSQTSAEALRAAATELGAKGDAVVLVARELVEMRTVQLPKMDADDLPDVIRFQAQRQFASMTDAWIVDFVVLPQSNSSEMQTALVAAIPPAQIAEIESACNSAGIQPTKITLRPLQMAQMAVDGGLVIGSGQSAIVCVSESIADIMILRDGKVIQVRTTKLPSEVEQVAAALQGELRRSLLAANSELDGKPIDSALLIATSARALTLSSVVQQTLSTKVTNFHPETLLANQDSSLADIAASRLVAIAGALTLGSTERGLVIDFKNPKRRPPKERNSRKYILYGSTAAVVLLAGIGWYYSRTSSLASEYAIIQQEIKEKQERGDAEKRRLAELASIEQFAKGSPNWLDEITYIAEKFPGADKILLENPTFSISPAGVGEANFTIKSVDNTSHEKFAQALRGKHYDVETPSTVPIQKPDGKFRNSTVAKVYIRDRGWDLTAPAIVLPETDTKDDAKEEYVESAQSAAPAATRPDSPPGGPGRSSRRPPGDAKPSGEIKSADAEKPSSEKPTSETKPNAGASEPAAPESAPKKP